MPDKFLACNAALNPSRPAFEGKSLRLDTKGMADSVQKIASVLSPLKQAGVELVAVDVQESTFHWLLLLALAHLDIPSCSLPPAEEGITKEAVTALSPDLIISFVKGAELYQGVEVMQLGQEWFGQVLNAPLNPQLKKDDFLPLAELLSRPLHVSMAGASVGGAQPVKLTRGMVREAMSRLLWMDATVTHETKRPIFVSTIHPSSLASFLAVCAAIGSGAFVRLHDPAHPALAFSGEGPFLAILTPAHLAIVLDELGPRAQPRPEISLILSGGIVSDRLLERCRDHLTASVRIIYATDETGPISMVRAKDRRSRQHVGPVLPWVEVRITDENGNLLPYGQSGDVRVKVANGISAYERSPDAQGAWSGANAHRFRDGWFLTGDRGALTLENQQEQLWIEGRADEMVTLGGGRFDLTKIDAAFIADPVVSDAVSFTYLDGDGNERLACAVVAVEGKEIDFKSLSVRFHNLYPGLPKMPIFKIAKVPRDMYGMPERRLIAEKAKGRIPKDIGGEGQG